MHLVFLKRLQLMEHAIAVSCVFMQSPKMLKPTEKEMMYYKKPKEK